MNRTVTAGDPQKTHPLARRDALHAGGAAAAALLLYAVTACRTIHTGDSPELALAVTTFGVPHPPGYALYTLLTGILARLLPFADRAFAANLLSGVYAAAAVGLTLLLLRRLGLARPACWFGALALAVGRTFWSQALVAEVYAFDALLLLAVLHALLTVAARPGPRASFCAGLLVGLWLGHRFLNAFYLPALLLWAWGLRRGERLQLDPMALMAGALAALAPLLYLPLASAADPALDIGDPQSWERFWTVISGSPYRRHLLAGGVSLGLLRIWRLIASLPTECAAAALLALHGAWLWLRRDDHHRALALGALTLICANLVVALLYRILDIQVYFLPSFVMIAILGAASGDRLLAGRPPPRALAAGTLIAAALFGLPLNLAHNDLRRHDLARRMAEDVLASVAPNALLFVNGDTVIHSLWYLQAVEKRAPGVVVVSLGHIAPWHLEQLARRFPNDPWPAVYPGQPATAAQAYAIMGRLGAKRPVFFSSDPARVLSGGGAAARAFVAVPRGMALELRRRDRPFDAVARAKANAAFLKRAVKGIDRRVQPTDVDTQAIHLEYALALFRCAGPLFRTAPALAEELLHLVLSFHPDRIELEMMDAYRSIGRHVPLLRLRQRALAALQARRSGKGLLPPGGPAPTSRPLGGAGPTSAPAARRPASRPTGPTSQPAKTRLAVAQLNQAGIRLAQRGQLERALARFEQVLRLMPHHLGAQFNRAKVLAGLGRSAAARAAYAAVLRRSPRSVPALVGLAELELRRDPKKAHALLTRALASPGFEQLKPAIRRRLQQIAAPPAPRGPNAGSRKRARPKAP